MPVGPDNTAYNPVKRGNGTYAVEIARPHNVPTFVEGFKSQAEAEEWIFEKISQRGSEFPSRASVDSFFGRGTSGGE